MESEALLIAVLALSAHGAPVTLEPSELPARLTGIPTDGDGLAGVALFDYDLDGDLDIYLGNGPDSPTFLYANDGQGTFTDVTAQAQAGVTTGARGILTADFDGDGFPDILITGDGGLFGASGYDSPTRMLMNNGDGTFRDASAKSGVQGAPTNMGAVAADIDNDGDLDVYVAAPGSLKAKAQHTDTLYINRGDGTFYEAAGPAGVGLDVGACAPQFTHLDDDGFIDLLVANCNNVNYETTPFHVFINRGDGTFVNHYEPSRIWGLGYWMGIALGDFDGDNDMDFFSTNSGMLEGPHALYDNNGDGTWTDIAPELGVAVLEFGWGAISPDFDNDGWVDLYYVGASRNMGQTWSPGYLFFNNGDGTFADPEIPVDLAEMFSGGLVQGDLDGDNYVDAVVTNTTKPSHQALGIPYVLMNQGGTDNHAITFQLRGVQSNLFGVGAQIRAGVGERTHLREVEAGSSVCGTNSPWPTIGLGEATEARVCVRWPHSGGEDFGIIAADQAIELVEGTGLGPVPCNNTDPWGSGVSDDTGDAAIRDREDAEGCTCSSSGGSAAGLLWLGALVVLRRRS